MMRNLFLFLTIVFCSCNAISKPGSSKQNEEEQQDSTKHLSLLFVGDLMQHGPQVDAARQADGSYDFSSYYEYLAKEIHSADVAIGNLEVTLGGTPYTGYPCFSAPDSYAQAIKDAGFDLLTTNNNHSCDRRGKGIERTIRVLDSLGIQHTGTYFNAQDRAKKYPYLIEKNGFRIAIVTYTYGTNGIPVPAPFVVNLIDKVQMQKDIQKAKQMNPDAIIAIMHWGIEYTMKPVKEQEDLANWLFAQGVTHVIGGHPHVVEPLEIRNGADGQKHGLVYSMGNFVSNQTPKPNQPKDGGIIVRLDLEKDSVTRLKDMRYSLIWVSRPVHNGKGKYYVLPCNMPESRLTASEKATMATYVKTARGMFSSLNKGGVHEYEVEVEPDEP